MNHTCGENCGAENGGDDPGCYAPNNCDGDKCGDLSCGESCGEGCDSLFGSSCGSCLSGLTSLLHKSDHCFDDFISPMTNPVNFEDPRTLTEARLIFVNNRVPAAVGGGGVQLYAMQLRAALNEDVSIIATKDGYLVSASSAESVGRFGLGKFSELMKQCDLNGFKLFETVRLSHSQFCFVVEALNNT